MNASAAAVCGRLRIPPRQGAKAFADRAAIPSYEMTIDSRLAPERLGQSKKRGNCGTVAGSGFRNAARIGEENWFG